jgi:hypothetical protein
VSPTGSTERAADRRIEHRTDVPRISGVVTASPETDRRAALGAYIAHSRAVQRGLRWLLAVGVVATIVLLLVGVGGASVFWLAVAPTAIVCIIGFWITYGHIADFEKELHALDAARRRVARGSLSIDARCDAVGTSSSSSSS